MPSPETLQYGEYYHIYNRGNNRDDIFLEHRNYLFFLERYKQYLLPLVETYAYCLLRNHFHFLIRIKEFDVLPERLQRKKPGLIFGNFFGSYAKAFNSMYEHSGSVFEHPFGRVRIQTVAQLFQVVTYIHQNPEKHGYVDDFREWQFSSFKTLIGEGNTLLERDTVIEWFGSVQEFVASHKVEGRSDLMGEMFLGES